MVSSSPRVKTLPVGLFGVLTMMARVRSLNAAARASGVERPVRRVQGHVARHGPRENRVRPVVLVERLEDDDLVAGVDGRQHRRHHGLGRAAAHRDLVLGVDGNAVPPRELARHRLAQRLRPPRHRVLVDVGRDRGLRRRLQLRGGGEVGKPLRKVDRPVPVGQPGHLPDHRLGEPRRLARTRVGGHLAAQAGASAGVGPASPGVSSRFSRASAGGSPPRLPAASRRASWTMRAAVRPSRQ